MSQPHLCFFSTRCRFSQNFLEALSKTPYSREFRFICVDPQPGRARPQLPAYVKAVPTLMIQGEAEPRTDSAVMNWLSERRLTDKSTAAGGHAATGGKPAAAGGGGSAGSIESAEGGPAAFTTDMCSAGDEGFCFINEMGFEPTKGQMPRLSGNMVSFNDPTMMGGVAEGPASYGAAGGGRGSNGMSEKAKALDDAYKRMMTARNSSVPGPVQRR
jgi:hypothetical protein